MRPLNLQWLAECLQLATKQCPQAHLPPLGAVEAQAEEAVKEEAPAQEVVAVACKQAPACKQARIQFQTLFHTTYKQALMQQGRVVLH